jgi:hypothetical protein
VHVEAPAKKHPSAMWTLMIKVQMVCVVEKRQQKQENNERSLGGGNGNGISVLFFFVDEIGFDTKLSKEM